MRKTELQLRKLTALVLEWWDTNQDRCTYNSRIEFDEGTPIFDEKPNFVKLAQKIVEHQHENARK